MKSNIKKLQNSQIELEIEVISEELDIFKNRVVLEFGKEIEIEGFRKGKAPREIIEKKIGQETILKEAVERAIKENYVKAVLENEIDPVGQPEIEIVKMPGDSLVFKAKTSVLPEVKLPDYKKIASRFKRNKIIIEEKEIKDALFWVQRSRAKFTLKTEPAKRGDWVEIDFQSPQVEENQIKQDAFLLGEGHLVPGFEENLEGMNSGQDKEFFLKFPDAHPQKDLAGKEITFKVKMKSVQNMELSEMNDEWAKGLGQFENLEDFKKNIKEGIISEKEKKENQRVRQEILDKVGEQTVCEIPEILVESEKNRMLEDLKLRVSQGLQMSFEDYLKDVASKSGKSEKEIIDSFLPEAQKRVKNFLILKEIEKKENIEVTEQEITEEVNKILRQYATVEAAKDNLDPEELKDYTKEAIRSEKTLAKLESFTSK